MSFSVKSVVTQSNFLTELVMLKHITFGHLVIHTMGPIVPKT